MARPKATVQTERLCVTIPTDEVKAAKKAAFAAGVTWADFVRQALASQGSVERRGRSRRPDPGSIPMERLRPPVNPGPIMPRVVDRAAVDGHEHKAVKVLSGGVRVCSCDARSSGGQPVQWWRDGVRVG